MAQRRAITNRVATKYRQRSRSEKSLMLDQLVELTGRRWWPGSLLKLQIPIRTWSEWDENTPGFVEIDLVGHEGGNRLR